jgi:septal ring-binding cell division protein DamX
MNEPSVQPSQSRSFTWVVIVLVVLVLVALGVVFFLWQDRDSASEETNTTVNSANGSVNAATVNETAAVDPNVTYTNPQFGYSVRYTDPDRTRTSVATTNPSENVYSEWVLNNSTTKIIGVVVGPKDKRTDLLAARTLTEAGTTEPLDSGIEAAVLNRSGKAAGYLFDYGNYVFILTTDMAPDSEGYTEFQAIAKSLAF